jgi:hypothetical protein
LTLQALRISGDARLSEEEKAKMPKPEIAPRAPCTPRNHVAAVAAVEIQQSL